MRKRIAILLGSFLIIYLFNFLIPRLMPGDPFRYTSSTAGEDLGTEYSEEQLAQLRAYYGLDKPMGQQFIDSVQRNLKGDMGDSIHYKKPVSTVLSERLPWTLYIMSATLILSLLAGSALALWCVRSRKADQALYPVLSAIAEIPPFLLGVLLLFLVAARVSWIPLSGAVTAFASYESVWQLVGDILVHSLMPVTALCLVTIPRFFFTARASFLAVADKAYMLGAKSRGLKERRIRWRYLLMNGVTPVIACFFLSVGGVVGGTLLIENVFAYPGLGTVLREAVRYRDYPMIQGVFLLSAVLVLVSLFVADTLNARVDREGRR